MRLRADPPRVTRISRKAMAGLGIVAGLGMGGALIYGLQGPDRQGSRQELITRDRSQPADGLNDLPGSYDAIPKLGSPLPGDLGGPILDAQERGQPVVPPTIATPAADPEEQRRLAEMEAAHTSKLFFQTQPGARTDMPVGTMPAVAAPDLGATGQDRHQAFLNADVDRRTVAPDRVTAPASPYVLQAGSVIPAALITGIRSDLPGQITAQVTQNVYDSPTGSLLFIPQGTRIIGEYDDGVTFGQRRVLLVWKRLIFPNGRSIVLERLPGADPSGYAGLEDGVDYHWWDLMKAVGLSTLLAVGAELATDDQERLVQAIRDGAQDTINDAGQRIVQRQLRVEPTLTIRPGFPVRVIVSRDLVLEPYGG
ncbi:conjugal transfer protein TraI [Pseudaminobacter manganicus]|uniref:Conjugal transfer protein TraI n=2 Tax=Manganibacter manganicus TaxID=1873176 RepID=A0A1V8RUN8_9HYPH|nr:conjugal transfer protein TraI [Pseudaminobacter manganicus]